VSENIIEASWQVLVDSINYLLMKRRLNQQFTTKIILSDTLFPPSFCIIRAEVFSFGKETGTDRF
jgi:hypothetical protein